MAGRAAAAADVCIVRCRPENGRRNTSTSALKLQLHFYCGAEIFAGAILLTCEAAFFCPYRVNAGADQEEEGGQCTACQAHQRAHLDGF